MRQEILRRQSSKEGVSDVSNVGFSEDTPKPPADCSNEMGEAITSAVVSIHDNNSRAAGNDQAANQIIREGTICSNRITSVRKHGSIERKIPVTYSLRSEEESELCVGVLHSQ